MLYRWFPSILKAISRPVLVMQSVIRAGLLEEVRASGWLPVWRRDDDSALRPERSHYRSVRVRMPVLSG
jgi:hypothetical protein